MGTGGCLAGRSYCRIAPEGGVTPCPYMPLEAGNVRNRDFKDIWSDSEIFNSLRKPALKGKCKECTFSLLCGGCRARAYAVHKDYLDADPWCDHIPRGGNVIKPPLFDRDSNSETNKAAKPLWTEEAEERLQKVPSFVRNMVRSAVEQYAIERKQSVITPGIMDEVKQKSGMGGMHGHR
jgi:AdoMet-dependent heme synthase